MFCFMFLKSERRRVYLFLIVYFLLLGANFAESLAQNGLIFNFLVEPKNVQYFETDPEKRKQFWNSLKKEVETLKLALRSYKPKNQEERKILKEASELYDSLPILWKSIEIEVSQKPETETITFLKENKKNYTMAEFRHILGQGYQIKHELEALEGKEHIETQDLNRIESTLEEVASDCVLLLKNKTKITELSPEIFLRLAEFLNLQAKWAIAKIELQKTSERIDYLKNLKKEWNNLIKNIFNKVKPTKKETQKLKQEAEEAIKLYENTKIKNKKIEEDYEKELALIEIRLTRLKPAATNIAITKSKYYETKKNLFNVKIKNLIEEERFLATKKEHKQLWAILAQCLAGCLKNKQIEHIDKLKEKIDQLKNIKENINYRLNYVREKEIIIKNNISLHKIELKQENNKKIAYFLQLTINQEKLLIKALDELKNTLKQEVDLLDKFLFEGETLIRLWNEKISFIQKAWSKTKKIFQESISSIKSFLFYPLWTSETTIITVFSLIKIIFILIFGIIALKLIQRRLEKFLISKFGMTPGVVNSLSTLSYYILLCLVILIALSSAGINMNQVALIFGALSVGIGFGLQTIANNFVSGIILLSERSIKVGDLVQLEDGTIGVVEKINIRSTVIRTFDALEIIVPNSEFVSQRISTWTYDDDWRRILVPFGVAYGTDPEKVQKVALEAARQVPITQEDADHPIRVRFLGFGESSLDFELAVWIRQSMVNRAMTGIKSDYYYALYRALTKAGIEIPFPQRDIHLRSIYPEAVENLKKFWSSSSAQENK